MKKACLYSAAFNLYGNTSYHFVSKILGIEAPENVHFFDDSERNTSKSREMGWNGYLVAKDDDIIDMCMRALKTIQNPIQHAEQ